MSLLPQPSFWAIQCHTYVGFRTLWHSEKLQSRRASQGWCTYSGILFNRLGNATYLVQTGHHAEILLGRQLSWISEESCSLGPQLIEGAFRSQWPCLQVTVLWVDTRKECGSHLMTSSVDGDHLRGTDIGYLALRPLSAWQTSSGYWCQGYSLVN